MNSKQPRARQQVTVLTHHTHAGKPVEPGAVLDMSAGAAAAMVRWGAGEIVAELPAATEKQGGKPSHEDQSAGA